MDECELVFRDKWRQKSRGWDPVNLLEQFLKRVAEKRRPCVDSEAQQYLYSRRRTPRSCGMWWLPSLANGEIRHLREQITNGFDSSDGSDEGENAETRVLELQADSTAHSGKIPERIIERGIRVTVQLPLTTAVWSPIKAAPIPSTGSCYEASEKHPEKQKQLHLAFFGLKKGFGAFRMKSSGGLLVDVPLILLYADDVMLASKDREELEQQTQVQQG
ncbi:hypothetical protein RB195_002859 [Necator americanus]|uniref:Reverse transcriptase domain-containing protein n=1 Tax=Necator americanus TaxID=51031 RepID=A0ABR1DL09_NECAM